MWMEVLRRTIGRRGSRVAGLEERKHLPHHIVENAGTAFNPDGLDGRRQSPDAGTLRLYDDGLGSNDRRRMASFMETYDCWRFVAETALTAAKHRWDARIVVFHYMTHCATSNPRD